MTRVNSGLKRFTIDLMNLFHHHILIIRLINYYYTYVAPRKNKGGSTTILNEGIKLESLCQYKGIHINIIIIIITSTRSYNIFFLWVEG